MNDEMMAQEPGEDQVEQVTGGVQSQKQSGTTIHITAGVASTSSYSHTSSTTNTATSHAESTATGGSVTVSVSPITLPFVTI